MPLACAIGWHPQGPGSWIRLPGPATSGALPALAVGRRTQPHAAPAVSVRGNTLVCMGITTAWAVSAHSDAFIAALAPRMLPLIHADRDDPSAQERWRRWQNKPLPDHRTWWEWSRGDGLAREAVESFQQLMHCGEHIQRLYDGTSDDDDFWLVRDVWERGEDPDRMFLSIQSKDYAVAAFFHVIGPRRAALVPGWCGNFLLTSAEVRLTLPGVERALAFTPAERAAAQDQDWLDRLPDEESVLDGPLRQWRQAARAGLGLCGVSVVVH